MRRTFILAACIASIALLPACGGVPSSTQALHLAGDARTASPTVYYSLPSNELIDGVTWLKFSITTELQVEGLGLCTDAAGDLFVPLGDEIFEYASGSTIRKATLNNNKANGVSCAIDPGSGNLAVMNASTKNAATSISIFRKAKGTRIGDYALPKMSHATFGAYDDKGNLFVDGAGIGSRTFQLDELIAGATAFTSLVVNKRIDFPAGVLWDGKYLAVGEGKGVENSVIYRFDIQGKIARLKGSVTLDESCGIRQIAMYEKILVAASDCTTDADLGYWKYPEGGSPVEASGNWGTNLPYGVAISVN